MNDLNYQIKEEEKAKREEDRKENKMIDREDHDTRRLLEKETLTGNDVDNLLDAIS